MDNEWNADASLIQDYYEMEPGNQMEPDQDGSDLLTRRLKNRERQRRYRARKRLEADRQRSSSGGATEPQLDVEPHSVHTIIVDRILCKRDWKKDARRAHLSKKTEDLSSDSTTFYFMGELSLNKTSLSDDSCGVMSCELDKMKAGGRNWKADARGKKT